MLAVNMVRLLLLAATAALPPLREGVLMSMRDLPRVHPRRAHSSTPAQPAALLEVHDQQAACSAAFANANASLLPTVLYIVGHLRSFRNYTAPYLQTKFCRTGPKHQFISTMVTREADILASDSKRKAPSPTAGELLKIRRDIPFCDPFFVRILSDSELRNEMPPWVRPYFRSSGHQGDSGRQSLDREDGWKGDHA